MQETHFSAFAISLASPFSFPDRSCHIPEAPAVCHPGKCAALAENFALVFLLQNDKVDFSYNQLADPKFSFYDKTLVEAVKSGDHLVYLFFLCLSLCHTVMTEEKVEGEQGPEPRGPRLESGVA